MLYNYYNYYCSACLLAGIKVAGVHPCLEMAPVQRPRSSVNTPLYAEQTSPPTHTPPTLYPHDNNIIIMIIIIIIVILYSRAYHAV